MKKFIELIKKNKEVSVIVLVAVMLVGVNVKAYSVSSKLDDIMEMYMKMKMLEMPSGMVDEMSMGAAPGNQLAENNWPYIMYNPGYNSAKSITTSDTVTGATVTDGTASMSSGALSGVTTLGMSGNLTISDGVASITYDVATTSDASPDMLTLTHTEASGLIVADGFTMDALFFNMEDDSGSATSTAKLTVVLDDTASTSLETSLIVYQKLDNAYTLSNVFEIDSGNGDFNYNLNVDGDTNVTHFTYGDGILASSTSNSAETMPVSYLTTYSSLDYTPGDAAVTLTLPATSTMTSFIPTAGDCYDFRLRNLDATAATSTTIAAGTGIDLVENENGDVVIEGGNEAQLKFCRESDTDVTVYVDEYIAAD